MELEALSKRTFLELGNPIQPQRPTQAKKPKNRLKAILLGSLATLTLFLACQALKPTPAYPKTSHSRHTPKDHKASELALDANGKAEIIVSVVPEMDCDRSSYSCTFIFNNFKNTKFNYGSFLKFYPDDGQPMMKTQAGKFNFWLNFKWRTNPKIDHTVKLCFHKLYDDKNEECGTVTLKTQNLVSSAVFGVYYKVVLQLDQHRNFKQFAAAKGE